MRVIAEAGMCANSLPWAQQAIDAAAEAGCWGFKVQMLSPDRLAAPNAPKYEALSRAATQHDAFQGALPYDTWAIVYDYARTKGLVPFASCWDEQAVEVSEAILKPSYYKVGSADITHVRLLRRIGETRKPVILSTGAATYSEIAGALDCLEHSDQIVLMACSLVYPCPEEEARLSRIGWLREEFPGFMYGYSDHTTVLPTGALAVTAGADWLERHFTVTPGAGGDHDFALTPDDMGLYVRMAERAEMMRDHPGRLNRPTDQENPARLLARRSLHAIAPIHKGDRLEYGVNVAFLRPWQYPDATVVPVAADDPIPATATRGYLPGQQIVVAPMLVRS